MFDHDMRNLMDAMVPISRFNKGEAGRIFEEVTSSGVKIVVKNNTPTCVLINPEKYKELMEIVENYQLFVEAEQRMKSGTPLDFLKQEDLLKKLQITEDELDSEDVELD